MRYDEDIGLEIAQLGQRGSTGLLRARDRTRGDRAAAALRSQGLEAMLGPDGPTGQFFGEEGALPW
jgi:hypothetical protein